MPDEKTPIPDDVYEWPEALKDELLEQYGINFATLTESGDPVALVIAAGMGEATLRAKLAEGCPFCGECEFEDGICDERLAEDDEEQAVTCDACVKDVPRSEAICCNGAGCEAAACSDCAGVVFDDQQMCAGCRDDGASELCNTCPDCGSDTIIAVCTVDVEYMVEDDGEGGQDWVRYDVDDDTSDPSYFRCRSCGKEWNTFELTDDGNGYLKSLGEPDA